jgi:hypothetical protein
MVLEGHAAIGFLYFLISGVPGDAEHLVVVSLGHLYSLALFFIVIDDLEVGVHSPIIV